MVQTDWKDALKTIVIEKPPRKPHWHYNTFMLRWSRRCVDDNTVFIEHLGSGKWRVRFYHMVIHPIIETFYPSASSAMKVADDALESMVQ